MAGPVGAQLISGGTASESNLGAAPDVIINDATIDPDTNSTIEIAYNASGHAAQDLDVYLVNTSSSSTIDSVFGLSSSKGTLTLNISAGEITKNTTVYLALTKNRTELANGTATIT
ncbi:MAG: hypothetical protein ABEI52_09430, partial [Halobacteriaceae archaeon]